MKAVVENSVYTQNPEPAEDDGGGRVQNPNGIAICGIPLLSKDSRNGAPGSRVAVSIFLLLFEFPQLYFSRCSNDLGSRFLNGNTGNSRR
jgi:hypothetical protein